MIFHITFHNYLTIHIPRYYLVFPSYHYQIMHILMHSGISLIVHHCGPLYATLLTHKKCPELPDFVLIFAKKNSGEDPQIPLSIQLSQVKYYSHNFAQNKICILPWRHYTYYFIKQLNTCVTFFFFHFENLCPSTFCHRVTPLVLKELPRLDRKNAPTSAPKVIFWFMQKVLVL